MKIMTSFFCYNICKVGLSQHTFNLRKYDNLSKIRLAKILCISLESCFFCENGIFDILVKRSFTKIN